ncbi:hypothetical protein BJ508DRAFT_313402 [Ascobolus immersus RN42]|uniref:Uncharacterized protein n=1 Tax=Ascobolus immersus RN42 TaxID=1160509 RepID=A0A3N4HN09_ASCIM|nr:hypothetical protein BJ508DRAFT_313402 [Ascobolus immersus RN42]
MAERKIADDGQADKPTTTLAADTTTPSGSTIDVPPPTAPKAEFNLVVIDASNPVLPTTDRPESPLTVLGHRSRTPSPAFSEASSVRTIITVLGYRTRSPSPGAEASRPSSAGVTSIVETSSISSAGSVEDTIAKTQAALKFFERFINDNLCDEKNGIAHEFGDEKEIRITTIGGSSKDPDLFIDEKNSLCLQFQDRNVLAELEVLAEYEHLADFKPFAFIVPEKAWEQFQQVVKRHPQPQQPDIIQQSSAELKRHASQKASIHGEPAEDEDDTGLIITWC